MPNAHVIGLGKSGIAAAKLLHQQGWRVQVSDRSPNAHNEELKNLNIPVLAGYVPDWSEPTQLVVVSPGVPWDSDVLIKARQLGIETIGEMELAWRHLKAPWVGITGTNGKTTTTALVSAIWQAAGYRAPACGNIGYASCELAATGQAPDWVIAEISSYQAEAAASISPQIGIWTTFTPDHLERHKTLENYYNIKASLLSRSQWQICNGDDPYLVAHWPDACWTSIRGKDKLPGDPQQGCYLEAGWVYAQGKKIVRAEALAMEGEHNQQNLLMAVLAAKLAGIDAGAIAQGVAKFPGVPHRLERIANWRGKVFINDSKATNYDAALVGLRSVPGPVVLIAGGELKQGDATAWLELIKAKAAVVLLIGKAAPELAAKLDQVNYSSYEIVETLDQAVMKAKECTGETVLLSPACASFDQYQSFEQRGEHFRRLCQELLV